ncbi:MAG: preprotein translocase subunit SecE [Chloroflexi bacterium]|nr:preprotein translocase subunit SecE [Chloroflexota bacterium]
MSSRGQGITGLFRELRAEIRKVIWPSRRQTVNMTAVIVGMAAALGAFLGLVDFSFQELFRHILTLTGAGGY